MTAREARHWLRDFTEAPEHYTDAELITAARRNCWHLPPLHPDRARLAAARDTLTPGDPT